MKHSDVFMSMVFTEILFNEFVKEKFGESYYDIRGNKKKMKVLKEKLKTLQSEIANDQRPKLTSPK